MARTRYSQDFRVALVKEVEKQKPSHAELIKLLKHRGVPRTTFLTWWKRYQQAGDVTMKSRGRPPAGFRQIVREEVERGLENYFDKEPED